MSNRLRFSIVGFGNIGRRHAEHILNNQNTELVAICDIKSELSSKTPEGVTFYTD
ncbi:MAG: Gfo/Idh/MocA family oxidoreductase, partial [Flavipsychrobacter sp.]